ncbi:MAG: GntR family transcriptional regulator, partial [Desulfovibrionaceae bacterium]|nr:GntR family transcriptional regulator [Desulfovibrionaceae bacterium]
TDPCFGAGTGPCFGDGAGHRKALPSDLPATDSLKEAILNRLKEGACLSVRTIVELSGLSRSTVNKALRELVREGLIEPTEKARNPRQRYRRV